jgi:serine/threonine protein kinase
MPPLSPEQWGLFSQHLGQALELSAAEREVWLKSLKTQSPEIAAAVVRALSAREAHGFAHFLADSLMSEAPATHATLSGRHIGPYVLESEVGRGGMGSVWRARRIDGRYEGTVAIKFVHAYWLGHASEGRFRSEGRLLARLDHPNIARLIDAGVFEETQPYLVLEYVEGEPIDEYCQRQQFGAAARVALFQGALAAVGHAHSQLIVHRDLKPSNILVTRDGTVKLLDFGVAKLLIEESGIAVTKTSAALTPQYAAPEQLLGQPVTTATDVYALGLVLFLLLTGEHPFPAAARSSAELVHAIVTQEPARASSLAHLTLPARRALEGDLDNILSKALRKDPTERYASVGALAEDLRRYLAHEPVLARPDTVPYRIAKFVRRNRGSVLSGVLIALGLIGTSAFALTQMHAARVERDRAFEEAKRANAQADLTQYILDDKLSKLSADAERQRLDRSRQFVAARFRNDPRLAARLLIDVSGRYIDIGEYRTAAAVMVEAEGIGHRFDDPDLLGQIACVRTEDLAIARDFKAAHEQLALGVAQMQRLHPLPTGIEAECATAEAFVAQADGDFARAITRLRATVADLDRAGMHGAARYTATSNDLARALAFAGQYREAFEVGDRNVNLVSEMGRADTNGYLAMIANACAALRNGGQPARAVAYVDSHTLKIPHQPDYRDMLSGLQACWALSRLLMGATETGEATVITAAERAERGGVSFQAALMRASAVNAALARGDLATAEARWAPLAADEERRLAAHEKGTEVVRLLFVQARLDIARQQPQQALRTLEHAAALIAVRHQATDPDARELATLRSTALLAQRQYPESAVQAQAAVDLATSTAIDPASSAWIGEALLLRARAEAAQGSDKAAATARQALRQLRGNLDSAHPLILEAEGLAGPAASGAPR